MVRNMPVTVQTNNEAHFDKSNFFYKNFNGFRKTNI